MLILIPAYEPDVRLINLVSGVRAARPDLDLVVVDDGSGLAYQSIFDRVAALGAAVVVHPRNRGKGAALKTGFAYAEHHRPGADVVCADCDGQHTLVDILTVADRVGADPHAMVLGARAFTGSVPTRSRFGNAMTRGLFTLSTGQRLADTQTGLRGYPGAMLAWLQRVPGDRFEYELNLLLQSRGAGICIVEVPIATVYLDGNASSHFRPVADSVRIYAPLLRFAASSLGAFALDSVALVALVGLTGNVLASVVGARLLSAGTNFAVNHSNVFAGPQGAPARVGIHRAALRYAALAGALLAANYLMLSALFVVLGLPLIVAKVATEMVLFVTGYAVQRRFVFAAHSSTPQPISNPAPR